MERDQVRYWVSSGGRVGTITEGFSTLSEAVDFIWTEGYSDMEYKIIDRSTQKIVKEFPACTETNTD